MGTEKRPGSPLGERIDLAMKKEGRSQNSVAASAGMTRGYLSRLISGNRGGTSVNPDHMTRLARVLHVNFEWLVTGEGPMLRGGREAETPFELAMRFAREAGCREDAIQAVWERNVDRAAQMSPLDWALAFDAEARILDRSGAPRPEDVAEHREKIGRAKRRVESVKARAENGGGNESMGTTVDPGNLRKHA